MGSATLIARVTYCLGLLTLCLAKVGPKVKCLPDMMKVEIPISGPSAKVYLQGLKDYPDPACRPRTDPSGSLAILELNLEDVYRCAITRVTNKLTGKQVYYQTVVIEDEIVASGPEGVAVQEPEAVAAVGPEKKHGQPQRVREVLHVKCSVSTLRNHTITRRNVLPAGFQEPEYIEMEQITNLTQRAPEPILGVGVRQGGNLVTGELNVSPGTPLQMEIFLDQDSAPIYGLLVTHMQVTDTKAQEETIIYNGCSVDPYLFENFNTVDGDFLSAKFRAFKFPESTYVQFKGTVNVCLDKCKGVECSDGQTGYGRRRRRRAIAMLPPDPNKIFEITITSFIKVNYDDPSENFENAVKKQKDELENEKNKFILGEQKKTFRAVDESPSNMGITKLVKEEEYIFAENSSSSSQRFFAASAISPLLTAAATTIFRFFL